MSGASAPTKWTLQPGVEQLAVEGTVPSTPIEIRSSAAVVASGTSDAQGSYLARQLAPGTYRVRVGASESGPVTVSSPDTVPSASLYTGQHLAAGFGYLQTRDGTTLSIDVMLPGPADGGPYPTVIEYSGYDPSNPANTTFGQLMNSLGLAYVGVNMRGTGCSGGSFSFFETAQLLDGYDAVEAVAAQPWVLGHKVGMVGISYPGISQLFVASTRPPDLEAITPLSVFDDAYRSTLYPGGILNTGFAVNWTKARMAEAQPFGQPWTKQRAVAGDTECAANQRLRLQNPDLTKVITDHPFYDPTIADPINATKLVGRIDVPVFLAGSWQDDQTGGHFPALLDKFTSAPHVYATLTNGLHTDSLSLGVLQRYTEFLDLYVAHRTPALTGLAAFIPGVLYQSLFGVSGMSFGPDRFAGLTYQQALAKFQAEPPVRVLFEEGDAPGLPPGAPAPRFSADFAAWPIAATVPTPWVLTPGPGGTSYRYDPHAAAPTYYTGSTDSLYLADAHFDWPEPARGAVVAFQSPVLTRDEVLVGSASADLWVTSSTPDTDIEVTLTEVRPDGNEVYIQSGWLRASQRALDPNASSELRPVQTHLGSDAAPLVPGQPTLVRVEIFPFAHVLRPGSRLRLVVGSPGGNRAQWTFADLPAGGTVNVLTDAAHASRLVLPVITGVAVPAGAPACGSLRGQPCRRYQDL